MSATLFEMLRAAPAILVVPATSTDPTADLIRGFKHTSMTNPMSLDYKDDEVAVLLRANDIINRHLNTHFNSGKTQWLFRSIR